MADLRAARAMMVLIVLGASGCSMKRANLAENATAEPTEKTADTSPAPPEVGGSLGSSESSPASSPASSKEPKDRLSELSEALSRATTRIEELDARISALNDKIEAQKIAVDNVLGARPMRTQVVGSVRREAQGLSGEAGSERRRASHVDPTPEIANRFREGMDLFKKGKFSDAVLAFNQITETHPDHVLAGSAQFQAGEGYYMMGEYKLALNEYGKVITAYFDSPRAASALVRLSHCYGALGNPNEAMRTLALARDMYFGNPSLDWQAPAAGRAKVPALNPEPMDAAPQESESKTEKTR